MVGSHQLVSKSNPTLHPRSGRGDLGRSDLEEADLVRPEWAAMYVGVGSVVVYYDPTLIKYGIG